MGSFHVGGRLARLEGMPPRERVSTPGGPVYHIDPNGDIVVGQMYVQFVRLGIAARLWTASHVAWRRHDGSRVGSRRQTGVPAGRRSSCAPASILMSRTRWSAVAHLGHPIRRSIPRRRSSARRRMRGRIPSIFGPHQFVGTATLASPDLSRIQVARRSLRSLPLACHAQTPDDVLTQAGYRRAHSAP